MKIWQRIGAMAMVTAFSALALTGCGSSSGGGDSAGSDGMNVGYVNLADTDVFCMARESALTAELEGTGYSVSFSDGNNDNQKQIDQTNAFLAKGVDALIEHVGLKNERIGSRTLHYSLASSASFLK